jgi:peptidoglycan/LPS O-acetylase OafA/YrhL
MTTVGVRAGAARRFKRRGVPLAVVVLLVALLLPAKSIFAQETQKYINGLWFNGQTFEHLTVFAPDGFLKKQHKGDL